MTVDTLDRTKPVPAPTTAGENRIYRLTPDGPNGLQRMTIDPDGYHKVPEIQHVHVYWADPELGMSVGVWHTSPMQEVFGPYPGDEFIVLVDGNFRMMDTRDGTGSEVACHQGQNVIFRNGAPVSWIQDGDIKKFYITYMDPRAAIPQIDTADGGIITLDDDRTLSDASLLPDTTTPQRDDVIFTNDHGNFKVGIWDTQAMLTDMEPFPWHEFCQILDGEVTITEEDGTAHHFKAGDVFFIPNGTVCKWDVPTYLRKYYATLDPSIRPGAPA